MHFGQDNWDINFQNRRVGCPKMQIVVCEIGKNCLNIFELSLKVAYRNKHYNVDAEQKVSFHVLNEIIKIFSNFSCRFLNPNYFLNLNSKA